MIATAFERFLPMPRGSRRPPDATTLDKRGGRVERLRLGCTAMLEAYLDLPDVAQMATLGGLGGATRWGEIRSRSTWTTSVVRSR